MPTARRISCAWLCAVIAFAATGAVSAQQRAVETVSAPVNSSSTAESLAARVFALADDGKFSEVEPLLEALAESHRASQARVAAVLYACERTYAAGKRPQAAAWLKSLATSAPQQFQTAIADAIAWCAVNPCDLKTPSVRLLELADQHGASSFAPLALQLRAKTLVAAKRFDEAIFVYHAALAQFPQSRLTPANLLSVARLHHELGQDREAWDYLQRLVKECGQVSQLDAALYLGVLVAQHLKDESAGRQWLEQLVTQQDQSPYWIDAACRLAEQHVAEGENEQAESLIAKILERSSSEKPEVSHRARFLLVRLAVAATEWPAVEQRSGELIDDNAGEPLKTLARFWHAEAAYRRGDRDAAFTRFLDLSLAIEGRKDDWLGIVPLRLAQIEAQRQNWSTALEWVELLGERYPHYSRMHEADYVRGRCLSALARFGEAREALAGVTGHEVAAKTEIAAMAQWLIGETYFQQRQHENAIAAYEQVLVSDYPQWRAAALLQTAKCCEQLSRWPDAAQRYERLINEYNDTRFVAEARTRLATTQERGRLAAQRAADTATR